MTARHLLILSIASAVAFSCSIVDLLVGRQEFANTRKGTLSTFQVQPARFRQQLAYFSSKPHPFGSARQKKIAQFLMEELEKAGIESELQTFEAEVPNPNLRQGVLIAKTKVKKSGQNIIAHLPAHSDKKCTVLVGSHYDTKVIPGTQYNGANDSGSSSILLLHLAEQLAKDSQLFDSLNCGVSFVWFDGEEAVLSNWTDGESIHPARIKDNTYGSRNFVAQLVACDSHANERKCIAKGSVKIQSLVLLDMVGMPNVALADERNSTAWMRRLAANLSANLGMDDLYGSYQVAVEDDHIPFIGAQIPSINLIDFKNLETWHRKGDDVSAISIQSIQKVGGLAMNLVLHIAILPKDSQVFSDHSS